MAKKNKKSILLIITGSIAAVKSLELISRLKDRNVEVTCVLTASGEEFVTALSCSSLSGNQTYTKLFDLKDETEMGHIRLSRENDLIVVAPASANIIGQMANGLADDLASTLLLATNKPVLLAPAMNHKMWENKAVARNVKLLKGDDIKFVGPEKGKLACGEEGVGRMAEVENIINEIEKLIELDETTKPLSGFRALVTSGPTIEAIDPVRYITNRSSGKQGHAIAATLAEFGADVTLVAGPTNRPDPENVNVVKVESAREMLEACKSAGSIDIAICAAAVADWGVEQASEQKIKKSGKKEDFTFTFAENPDILVELSKHSKARPKLVIGFAAETEHVVENARVKLEQKGCDWIVANDVSDGAVFESDENTVYVIDRESSDDWPKLTKEEVAKRLVTKISEHFNVAPVLKVVGE